jgi:hypothetical protein
MENPTANPTISEHEDAQDQVRRQRDKLKHRHAQQLTRLMDERQDLRGVHALADFVDDSVRWSA